jgi:hypothetical protein
MMSNDIDLFDNDDFSKLIDEYSMLKLASDISNKYSVEFISPCYGYYLSLDGKMALRGYHVKFINNDKMLSVQFGGGNYCENSDSLIDVPNNQFSYLEKANTAEIAILTHDGLLYVDEWNDSVAGWQTPDEIMNVIDKYIIGNLLDT